MRKRIPVLLLLVAAGCADVPTQTPQRAESSRASKQAKPGGIATTQDVWNLDVQIVLASPITGYHGILKQNQSCRWSPHVYRNGQLVSWGDLKVIDWAAGPQGFPSSFDGKTDGAGSILFTQTGLDFIQLYVYVEDYQGNKGSASMYATTGVYGNECLEPL